MTWTTYLIIAGVFSLAMSAAWIVDRQKHSGNSQSKLSLSQPWAKIEAKRIEDVRILVDNNCRPLLAFSAFGHKVSHAWEDKSRKRTVCIPASVFSTHPLNCCPTYVDAGMPHTKHDFIMVVSDLGSAIGLDLRGDAAFRAELGVSHYSVIAPTAKSRSALIRLQSEINLDHIAYIRRKDNLLCVAASGWRHGSNFEHFVTDECKLISNALQNM